MRTLIVNAISFLDREREPETPEDRGQRIPYVDRETLPFGKGDSPNQKPDILIVGCGGTGNSVINRLFHGGFSGPRTMVVDNDKQTFEHSHASVPFFLQRSYFPKEDCSVSRGHPDCVDSAAENARNDLERQIGTPDLCIIVAGLSAGTGCGSAPVVARIAKAHGAVVTAFVTIPSDLEKTQRVGAQNGLDKLLIIADSVFTLDLKVLFGIMPEDLPLKYGYSAADQVLAETIRNLYQRVCTPSLMNLDFSDLTHLLAGGGYGILLFGETREDGFVGGVCRDCLNIMTEMIPVSVITGMIVLIEGHYAGIHYSDMIATELSYNLDPRAEILWGSHEDHAIPKGEVRVFALASTGRKTVSFRQSPKKMKDPGIISPGEATPGRTGADVLKWLEEK